MTNEELRDYMEDMIVKASQQADAATINLSARFEAFEEKARAKDAKRWSWFKFISLIIVGVTIPLTVIVYDKSHDLLFSMDTRLGKIEERGEHTVTEDKLMEFKLEIIEKIHQLREELILDRRSTYENTDSRRRSDINKHLGKSVW